MSRSIAAALSIDIFRGLLGNSAISGHHRGHRLRQGSSDARRQCVGNCFGVFRQSSRGEPPFLRDTEPAFAALLQATGEREQAQPKILPSLRRPLA